MIEVNIQVRSMGPISEMDMVTVQSCYRIIKMLYKPFIQSYSMDCYFRQSWVDQRLSFKGYRVEIFLVFVLKIFSLDESQYLLIIHC